MAGGVQDQPRGGQIPAGLPRMREPDGVSGADAAGYRVANPSLSAKTIHIHQSGFRRYPATDHAVKCKDRIPAPYLYCAPHRIGDEPRIKIDLDGPNLPEAEETLAAVQDSSDRGNSGRNVSDAKQ